ncbi:hypothetical protein FRX31_022569 [Thalictrum thalictroides]|uniref:Uncharacterized protein n=1 Tax=Thalictrum thalictroides TaxID=46969 RepID=A0A7J6VRX0_THATH|nr:hypothetical protein FRX31_022569 [Thalictrum thalictroides]
MVEGIDDFLSISLEDGSKGREPAVKPSTLGFRKGFLRPATSTEKKKGSHDRERSPSQVRSGPPGIQVQPGLQLTPNNGNYEEGEGIGKQFNGWILGGQGGEGGEGGKNNKGDPVTRDETTGKSMIGRSSHELTRVWTISTDPGVHAGAGRDNIAEGSIVRTAGAGKMVSTNPGIHTSAGRGNFTEGSIRARLELLVREILWRETWIVLLMWAMLVLPFEPLELSLRGKKSKMTGGSFNLALSPQWEQRSNTWAGILDATCPKAQIKKHTNVAVWIEKKEGQMEEEKLDKMNVETSNAMPNEKIPSIITNEQLSCSVQQMNSGDVQDEGWETPMRRHTC